MSKVLSFLKATDWLFDIVPLRLVPRMNYWSDGEHGRRVLFITDEKETFTISFEEGIEYPDYCQLPGYICAEQQKGCFRLRQCRGEQRELLNNVCVFQIEWTDQNGIVHIQPGQMVTGFDYIWADGVEPVLLSFVASLQEPCSDIEMRRDRK